MQRIDRILTGLEVTAMVMGGVLLAAMTLIATTDVAMRYALNAPLSWSYDLISLYLLTGVFYLGLSNTLRVDGHISVDILHNRMPPRLRHAALVAGYALALFVFLIMLQAMGDRTVNAYVKDEAVVGSILWPTWIPGAMVTLGLGLTSARIAYRTAGHLFAALTGREVIALPPLSGQEAEI